ncbi:2-hydroxychromene-2-carboxylate isomerase [soil metagenome]
MAAIEFWFEFGSSYSYLSVMRIEALAQQAGVEVRWRPFLLGPIFKQLGFDTSPFVLQPEKGAYVWRDMARQSAKFGLPWRQPSRFPRRALLPMRVAMLGCEQPWIDAFCREMMMLNFALDTDIEDRATVAAVLARLGLEPDPILAAAEAPSNKSALHDATDTARRRGVFGAPTFFVGDEMYWGNDRLDDALAAAASAVAATGASPAPSRGSA